MNKDELRELARICVRSTKTEDYLPKMLSLNSEEIKVITPLIKEESHLYTQEINKETERIEKETERIEKELEKIRERRNIDTLSSYSLFPIGEA